MDTLQVDDQEIPLPVVAGIDPGLQRLGVAVVNFETKDILRWGCLAIFPPKGYHQRQVAANVNKALITEMGLDKVDAVVMEEQFLMPGKQPRYKCILYHLEGVLAGLFQKNGWMVQARHSKRVFGLCTGERASNKEVTIHWVQQFVWDFFGKDSCPEFDSLVESKNPIAADMADAMLQCIFFAVYGNFGANIPNSKI